MEHLPGARICRSPNPVPVLVGRNLGAEPDCWVMFHVRLSLPRFVVKPETSERPERTGRDLGPI